MTHHLLPQHSLVTMSYSVNECTHISLLLFEQVNWLKHKEKSCFAVSVSWIYQPIECGHRQQWWGRCCWMKALSGPADSDSLPFLLEPLCAVWEPSSHAASSSSSVGGRRQVGSKRQQVVCGDSRPLRLRLNSGVQARLHKVNLCPYLFWCCESTAVDLMWQ